MIDWMRLLRRVFQLDLEHCPPSSRVARSDPLAVPRGADRGLVNYPCEQRQGRHRAGNDRSRWHPRQNVVRVGSSLGAAGAS